MFNSFFTVFIRLGPSAAEFGQLPEVCCDLSLHLCVQCCVQLVAQGVFFGPKSLKGRISVMLRSPSVLLSLFDPCAPRMRRVTAVACFFGVMFVAGAAQAGIIFTDGFEGGKLFADPTGYGTRVATIEATSPRSGANAVFLNNKEGVFYSLPDVYQPGTYTRASAH